MEHAPRYPHDPDSSSVGYRRMGLPSSMLNFNADNHHSTLSAPPTPGTPTTSSISSMAYSPASRHHQSSLQGMDRTLCAICGDRASGKHYGAYSCEGCKGFFKRTVRKDLKYVCRDQRRCLVDKRQRNRCQFCRYQKCLYTGMRRESVQEERRRNRQRADNEVGSTDEDREDSSPRLYITLEALLQAEGNVDRLVSRGLRMLGQRDNNGVSNSQSEEQAWALVLWAKQMPYFSHLPVKDQSLLLTSGWNELMIVITAYRSLPFKNILVLGNGLPLKREEAYDTSIGCVYDRILFDVVDKMREMQMDRTEVTCIRAIILLNPDTRGLSSRTIVERLRDQIYAQLDKYCRTRYPEDPGRFAKLLLRLPALRSIGLKCLEQGPCINLIVAWPQRHTFVEIIDQLSV